MSRYYSGGGGGGGGRRPAPSYQTSSSSRNNSSSGGAPDRDYSRSHLSGNGGGSAGYYSSSASSRKPESGGTTGYSYLEPNWIEKTRSSLPIDPYSSGYLDRPSISTTRDYTSAAAAAAASQPVYASAAAAALSVGAYGANSNMPKAYARPEEYFRAVPAPHSVSLSQYGYGGGSHAASTFEQSTMAAQAAALYEMQNAKQQRDEWPASAASHHGHQVDYGRRGDDRRDDRRAGSDRRRDDGGRGGGREEGRRVEERRVVGGDSWREREREVPRGGGDRDRRPSLQSRDRGDRDMRVIITNPAAAASSSTRRDDRRPSREVGRRPVEHLPAPVRGGGAGRRDERPRDRDVAVRDVARDASSARRLSALDKRTEADTTRLDRESRELERRLAKVQRELQQLEAGGKGKAGERASSGTTRKASSRDKERESDRSRRPPPPVPTRRSAASPPRRSGGAAPPRRSAAERREAAPPARVRLSMTSAYGERHRTFPSRPSTLRSTRPRRPVLPSLMDAVVPRPGGRRVPATRVSRGAAAWEPPVRRGAASRPLPPAKRAVGGYATKRGVAATRAREPALSSREKVRRAKEKLRRDEERRKRNDKKREERSKESREKRKEEDFAWLETIMSEDEELDEETNRKLLLAPRQRRVAALVERAAVLAATLEQLEKMEEGGEAEAEEEARLWTAEEADAIELLPLEDTPLASSFAADVAAAFLAAHPEPLSGPAADAATVPTEDTVLPTNGTTNGTTEEDAKMEE